VSLAAGQEGGSGRARVLSGGASCVMSALHLQAEAIYEVREAHQNATGSVGPQSSSSHANLFSLRPLNSNPRSLIVWCRHEPWHGVGASDGVVGFGWSTCGRPLMIGTFAPRLRCGQRHQGKLASYKAGDASSLGGIDHKGAPQGLMKADS
jgi:hypothetical protein